MYDYNTLEGKILRVEELRKLQNKVACVPGKFLNYGEAVSLGHYLGDIVSDLERQIKTEKATKLWEELEKCATTEEIAQLYDLMFKPT